MVGPFLALLAALAYGSGDFTAGVAARRVAAVPVAVVAQTVGLFAIAAAVLVYPGAGPSTEALTWGAISGVGAGVGTLALYQGLSVGAMSVVAPVSAVLAAALPAAAGLLAGEMLPVPGLIGLVVGVLAIGLVSATTTPGPASGSGAPRYAWAALGFGTLSGAGFALLFIALDRAGPRAGAWPVLPSQAVALLLILAIAVMTGDRPRRSWRPAVALAVFTGIAGAAATLLFLVATGTGQLAAVAVITALYPAVTVILARLLLTERWTRSQIVGLLAAATATALISLS